MSPALRMALESSEHAGRVGWAQFVARALSRTRHYGRAVCRTPTPTPYATYRPQPQARRALLAWQVATRV
jgi:hypothetical protein